MNVTRENIDALNAVVRISVEKADYEQKVEEVLKQQRRNAQIKGFRPGMAPMGLIRKLYGKAVLFEELNKLVSQKLSDYIVEEKLEILGDPMPHETDAVDLDEKTDFTFSFDLGLTPEFEPVFQKKNKIPYYIITPDDKMKEGFIDNHRRRHGKYTGKEISTDHSMIKGTVTALDENMKALSDGITVKDASLLLSMVDDDTEKSLFTGKAAGDRVIFDIRKTFRNETDLATFLKKKKEELTDVKGHYRFEIESISTFEPAPLDTEFFSKVYGIENMSEADFYSKIEEEIAGNLRSESDYRFRIDAVNFAVAKTEFDLPDDFLKRWLLSVNKNLTEEQLEKEFDGFRKDMKWQLIRNRIARTNELKVSEDDLLREAMAVTRNQFMQYGLYYATDEQIENYARELIRKDNEAGRLADRILDSKVVGWIRENVKLEEKKISSDDFNKLFE